VAAKNVDTEETTVGAEIPHQVANEKPSNTKNDPAVVVENENETPTFMDKIKNLRNNKKLVAAVSTVVLVAVGAVIVKKRNSAVDMEDETASS
jgi:hypothetical protein